MDLAQNVAEDVALSQFCEDVDVLLTQMVHVVRMAFEFIQMFRQRRYCCPGKVAKPSSPPVSWGIGLYHSAFLLTYHFHPAWGVLYLVHLPVPFDSL